MANKWMTADEWRATKGAERAEARKRAEEERDERMRVAVERHGVTLRPRGRPVRVATEVV